MFTNPMLLLEASKGYWRFFRVDVPFIFVYFLDVIDCRSVQVSVFTLYATWCIEYIELFACCVTFKVGSKCGQFWVPQLSNVNHDHEQKLVFCTSLQ